MWDQAGRLTRRRLLGGVVGLGVASAPRLFAFAGVPGGRRAPSWSRPTSARPAEPPVPTASVTPGTEPRPDESAPPDAEPGSESDLPLFIHSRKEWGAKSPKHPAPLLSHGPNQIVIHHTNTPNSTDLSQDHAFLLSRQIQAFHMNRRGWDDIGEQLTISRGGLVMEGRNGSLAAILAGRNVLGAQTLHHNEHTLGIENEGTYTAAAVPPTLWAALVQACTWLCQVYGLDPRCAIVGHRDLVRTDCPGDVLYGRLPELRTAVAQGLPRQRTVRQH